MAGGAVEPAITKKGKGGRKAANPSMTDEQRRQERVLKNRVSAMKSLQKKKRYTDDLEKRAKLLTAQNIDLKTKIYALVAKLAQSGVNLAYGAGGNTAYDPLLQALLAQHGHHHQFSSYQVPPNHMSAAAAAHHHALVADAQHRQAIAAAAAAHNQQQRHRQNQAQIGHLAQQQIQSTQQTHLGNGVRQPATAQMHATQQSAQNIPVQSNCAVSNGTPIHAPQQSPNTVVQASCATPTATMQGTQQSAVVQLSGPAPNPTLLATQQTSTGPLVQQNGSVSNANPLQVAQPSIENAAPPQDSADENAPQPSPPPLVVKSENQEVAKTEQNIVAPLHPISDDTPHESILDGDALDAFNEAVLDDIDIDMGDSFLNGADAPDLSLLDDVDFTPTPQF